MKISTPIIDAHVHVFPPAMIARREALLAQDPWFGEAFGHPSAKMRTVEDLIASMDRAGVDISIMVGWPWQSNILCAEHNSSMAEAVARWPDRLRWLGIVNPAAQEARSELVRCIDLGASGFGEINADGQGFSWSQPESYKAALIMVAEAGLPVMCHTTEPVGHRYPGKGSAHPQEIMQAIDTVPNLKWILAHWGGGLPFYELMPEVKRACAHVSYDSAATSYLFDPIVFRRVIDLVGVEKVVFGSDWPVLAPGKLIQRVADLPLTPAELAPVLGGNAARIYGIS